MKNGSPFLALLAVALATSPAASAHAQAHASEHRFYLTTDFGVGFLEDADITTFASPLPNPTLGAAPVVPPAGGQATFHPGFRFDASGGYEFALGGASFLSAELATGLIFNRLDKLEWPGRSYSARGEWFQVPVLGNVIWRYRLAHSITPYLGGGGGAIFSAMSVDSFSGYGQVAEVDESDLDTVGAYQAFAGVQFDLSDTTALGLAYKFLGTSGPAWSFSGGKVELDNVIVHTLALTLTYRF